MSKEQDRSQGCGEYSSLSRRHFLRLAGGAALVAGAPNWLPRVALADSHDSGRDVLIHIFLPGGCDGLSLCVPHAEDNYYTLRPNIAVPRPDSGSANAALDLDGFFGLPPALGSLNEAYQAGDLLFVQACGSTDPTRSHFEAINFMQVGVPQPPGSLFTGWLGRYLMTSAPSVADGAMRAVALGFGLPRVLLGGPSTLPVRDLARHDFAGDVSTAAERRAITLEMYRAIPDPLKSSAEGIDRTIELLDAIDFDGYQPAGSAVYPGGDLGYALSSTAALIKADVGAEVVHIDYGGWDTHDFQGPVGGGMHYTMMELGDGLAALHHDLEASGADNVTVVVMSEFGRNVIENGSFGTDHGHGNVMLVMGKNIAGGQVLAQWPGLGDGQLYDGQDLAVTIDYRDVVAEVLERRLGSSNLGEIFPDPAFTPTFRGVTV